MPHTRATLRALQEKFDRELLTASTDEDRYANREALKQQVQRLVATEGQVYLPALPRAVQDFSGTYVPCNVWGFVRRLFLNTCSGDHYLLVFL